MSAALNPNLLLVIPLAPLAGQREAVLKHVADIGFDKER